MIPAHNFTVADLLAATAAICLFPLIVFIPGYVIGWLFDLFDFRRRTWEFRAALSVPLSISLCPVLSYLAGRFCSMYAVWALYAVLWACFAALAIRRAWRGFPRLSLSRQAIAAIALALAWTALALFSLIDLQFGNKDYYSTIAFDFSIRSQFIHSITTTGIPPANPFFLPGHPVALRYHYFWLILCSLVSQAGGAFISPRQAWMGGVVWCGIGFMALIALYFRLFVYKGPATFHRRTLTGILLLGVTGLGIIPTAILWGLFASGMKRAVLPSLEWWNQQVDGFTYTALWEAHYLSGLIACLMAFLLLSEAPRRTAAAERVKYAAIAGAALASSLGASIYVGFVFGMFLLVWTAVTVAKKWFRETAALITAGLIAIALFVPYALDLRGPLSGAPVSSSPPLTFWIRPLVPIDALFRNAGFIDGWRLSLVNGLLLPLNYLMELGFFLAAALVWWQRRRSQSKFGEPFARAELATACMVTISVLICTFLRSSIIGNNDLGWRGFLIAQFGLLLWAVDLLTGPPGRHQALLTVLLVLGAAGTVYDVGILRFYGLLADRGVLAPINWMAPDRKFGERNYASREAYEWAAHTTPPTAVVQFNPHVAYQETSALLYANRQFAAGDESCLSGFGGDPALCPAVISELKRIYPLTGPSAPRTIESVCRNLPVDIIVAKDTDPVWSDRSSWVWTGKPVFSNRYLRLFGCPKAGSGGMAAP